LKNLTKIYNSSHFNQYRWE